MSVRLVQNWVGNFPTGTSVANYPVGGSGIPAGDVIVAGFVRASSDVSVTYSDSQGNTWVLKGGFRYCMVTNPLASTDNIIRTINRSEGGSQPAAGAIAHIEDPSWEGEPGIANGLSISETQDDIETSGTGKWLILSWQADNHGTAVGRQIVVAPIATNFTELAYNEFISSWDVAYRMGYKIVDGGGTVSFISTDEGVGSDEDDWDFANDIISLSGFGRSGPLVGSGIPMGVEIATPTHTFA